ncbi:hypothetical protein A3Q56_00270 [Intoshia linei]|uniref:Uncharacterized protein n=1 Tax=Intoshia linei TaxID=1819745 RepID=A0A177BCA7_9BILA|nr:hypothetical protein A3Q56_00270 [Intoshia linei]
MRCPQIPNGKRCISNEENLNLYLKYLLDTPNNLNVYQKVNYNQDRTQEYNKPYKLFSNNQEKLKFATTQKKRQTKSKSIHHYNEKFNKSVNMYGWKMLIPGDPLNLKKPCIIPRATYQTPCKVKSRVYNPPVLHKEFKSVMFYQTSDPKKYSYIIHPSWTSENYKAPNQNKCRDANFRYVSSNFVY